MSRFYTLRIVLAALASGILFLCLIPITSGSFAHILLSPVEKKLKNKIEFESSSIWLPGNISLEGVAVTDASGRFYHVKSVYIKYNLAGLLLRRNPFFFNLKNVKFFHNVGLFNSVADMLVISKLPDLEFKEIRGSVELLKNGVRIKDIYAYNDLIRIKGGGMIDNTGTMNCDITFSFNKGITDKIPVVVRTTLLSPEDEGWMSISFKAKGNYKMPSLELSGNRIKLNVIKGLFINE